MNDRDKQSEAQAGIESAWEIHNLGFEQGKRFALAEYFVDRARKAGLVGGKSKSPAKRKAAAENLKRARAARAEKREK